MVNYHISRVTENGSYPYKVHIHIGGGLYLNLLNSVNIVVISILAGKVLIVYYPMLISNSVLYWKLSRCCTASPILCNGYGFQTISG